MGADIATKASDSDNYKFYIRLHNLPRKSSLCQIFHFLWEVVDFESEDAYIHAYSSKNAIIGFTKQMFADDAVRFCNGRNLYGRIISVHSADEEDLRRVIEETKEAGPEHGPPRLGKRKNLPDDDDTTNDNGEYGTQTFNGHGLNAQSDSESDGELDLPIPDFFLKGSPPDKIDFNSNNPPKRRHSSGSMGMNGHSQSSIASMSSTAQSQSPDDDNGDIEIIESGSGSGVNQRKNSQGQGIANGIGNNQAIGVAKRIARMDTRAPSDIAYRSPLQGPVIPEKRPRIEPPPQQRPPFPHPTQPATVPVPVPVKRTGANALPMGQFRPLIPGSSIRPIFFPSPSPLGKTPRPPSQSPRHQYPPPTPPTPGQCKAFNVNATISSKHCLFKWELLQDPPVDYQQFEIFNKSGESQIMVKRLGRENKHLLPTTEGAIYTVHIKGYDKIGRQLTFASKEIRACFSKNEISQLCEIACNFCAGEKYQFSILHRCKPRTYFDDIYNQTDGRRLMMPYMKDENGHPGSPINSKLMGFFFSTLLITDSLPERSPFGDVQMVMDAHKMLDFTRMNMYFADFYCNEAFAGQQGISSSFHYITVVICKKGSDSDEFCKDRLVLLDPYNNKFLQVRREKNSLIYLTATRPFKDLLIEVYYTEPISLFDAKEFNKVIPMGKGSSRPMGLPNNKLCRTCNFPA